MEQFFSNISFTYQFFNEISETGTHSYIHPNQYGNPYGGPERVRLLGSIFFLKKRQYALNTVVWIEALGWFEVQYHVL